MENDILITQYIEKYYTRNWQDKRICMICDKPVKDSEILEHFKKYHKNIYNDLLNQADGIEKIMKNTTK